MPPSGGVPFDFNQPAHSRPVPVPVAAPPRYRHPLGLPQGSVRALLTFMVLGMFCTLLLLPRRDPEVHVPLYLDYLVFLILGHYFAARGHSPANPVIPEPHPLWLPRGSIRFLILIGLVAVVGWAWYKDPELLLERLRPDRDEVYEQSYLPLVLVGMFFLGILVSRIGWILLAGPDGLPGWFQDVLAWVSLLAILGLSAEVILQLVIRINLTEINVYLPHWQAILTGIIAFYFGARS
jgi:hypothetical protein